MKTAIQLFIGFIFILSGFLKYQSIDVFELYLHSLGFFNFTSSSIFSRLLISTELVLGFLLLLNIRFKSYWKIAFGFLTGFSIFLVYLIWVGDSRNCNCFGEFLSLSPLQSLVKNILLLILLYQIREHKGFNILYPNLIMGVIFAVSFFLLPILSPPDFLIQNRYGIERTDTIEFTTYLQTHFPDDYKFLSKGKKVISFFSTGCRFCKMTAQRFSNMKYRGELSDSDIFYFFAGTEDGLQQFWEETEAFPFEHKRIPQKDFFQLSGKRLPAIILLNDGEFQHQYEYRNLDEHYIEQYLKEKK